MKVIRTWYTTSGPIHLESGRFKLNRAPDWRLKIEDPWKKFSRDLQSSIRSSIQAESGRFKVNRPRPRIPRVIPSHKHFHRRPRGRIILYGVHIAHSTVSRFPIFLKVLLLGLNGTGTPKQEKGQKRTTREVRFTVKAYRAQIGLNGHRPIPVPAYTTTRVGLYYC